MACVVFWCGLLLGSCVWLAATAFPLDKERGKFFLNTINSWDYYYFFFFFRGTVLWGLSTALKRSVLLQVRYTCSNPGIKSLLLFPMGSWPGILYVCNFMVGVQHERSIAACDILLLSVMPSFLHNYLNSSCAESLPSLPILFPALLQVFPLGLSSVHVQNPMCSSKPYNNFQYYKGKVISCLFVFSLFPSLGWLLTLQ